MSVNPTPAPDPGPDSDPPAPSGQRLERQLAMLDALALVGVKASEAVGRMADDASAGPAEIALAYARVSRAVRLAMLQATLQQDADKAAKAAKAEAEEAIASDAEYARCRVGAVVMRVAKEAHPDDEDAVDRLVQEADDRLDDDDLYGDILERPMSEIVARLCADLGLSPDWTRLAEELWARDEAAGDKVGEPLKAPPRASAPARGGGLALGRTARSPALRQQRLVRWGHARVHVPVQRPPPGGPSSPSAPSPHSLDQG